MALLWVKVFKLKSMRLYYFTAILCFQFFTSFSQISKDDKIFKALRKNDSLLFDVAFNRCELAILDEIIHDDFEFYHDKAGITSSKSEFISSIKNGICNLNYKPIRKLELQSLEVFTLLKNGEVYGAIQNGKHHFFALEKDKPEYLTSTAQFSHLWLFVQNKWKLSRVLSYNHQEPPSPINQSLLFKDKAETEKWMKSMRIPALGIGVIKDGKIVESTVYGQLAPGKPAPHNSIFNVASLTKPITALVALKLINEGKLSLDEPLHKYWIDPDISKDSRVKKLTPRIILSHQTGFPNWRYQKADGKLAFEFEPGTRYQYSGEGMEYLRIAIEKKLNTTLEKLAQHYIFEPLEMKDTHFVWNVNVNEERFAKWHSGNGELYVTDKNKKANAADDVLTTIPDYLKFMQHIVNGAGLNPALYDEMIKNQVKIKEDKYFGLGWSIDENIGDGERALVHGGDDKGVHTIAFLLPKSKQGLLIFTNCDNGTDIYIPTILAYWGKLGQGIIDVEMK